MRLTLLVLLILLVSSCGTKGLDDTGLINCSAIARDDGFILFNLHSCEMEY